MTKPDSLSRQWPTDAGIIRTERLVLRPIRLDDVDLLVRLDGDPEVMEYLTGGRASSRSEVEQVIRRRLRCRWIAQESVSGEFAGWFGLVPTQPGQYDVGYRLPRAMWGKGLATEGSTALVTLAFEKLRASRVTAQTMAVNKRSRAVMQRIGMRHLRTFHEDWDDPIPGTEEGEVEYGITREEWLRQR